ncbi:hypothetical protein RQP46_001573 [Phenoliferia psychrophenolica]
MDDPGLDSVFPNEILDQIFEIIASPLGSFCDPKEGQAVRDTFRSASLVCKRWQALVPRFLERCVHLPWTNSQLDSYTSRPRCPATTVRVLKVPLGDAGGARLIQAFESLTGVKRMQLVFQYHQPWRGWMLSVLRSECLRGKLNRLER